MPVSISLTKLDPTQMTPESLKKQLDAIGLTCSDADEDKLQGYIDDTRKQMPTGSVQCCAIWKLKDLSQRDGMRAEDYELDDVNGNWTVNSGYPDHDQLMYIQYKSHFQYLDETKSDFCGTMYDPGQQSGTESTVEAVQEQFVQAAVAASKVVVDGVDQTDMEAAMSNSIATLTDDNASDYEAPGNKVLFLVYDYDDVTKLVNGLGVLTIDWYLTVKDYKEKDKDATQHAWTLDMSARSALYPTTDELEADYDIAWKKFGYS